MYDQYNSHNTNDRNTELEEYYDEHLDHDGDGDAFYAKNSKRHEQNKEQQRVILLRSREEFEHFVENDQVNLCCVIITSTLCKYCGVNKLKYPKYIPYNAINPNSDKNNKTTGIDGSSSSNNNFSAYDNDATNYNNVHNQNNENYYGQDDKEDDDEDSGNDNDDENNNMKGNNNDESGVVSEDGTQMNVLSSNHFFNEIKSRLVVSPSGLTQRKHVRFFHICLCTEEETDIQPLLASDITHTLSGEPPSVELEEQLHKKAYTQLIELLASLEVCSTPCMIFFVRGQRVRYSQAPLSLKHMHANSENNNYTTNHSTVALNAQHDTLIVTGCNFVKWKKTLHNAIVIRNEVLKAHDDAEREAARQARREAVAERKRLLKEARKAERRKQKQQQLEEQEYELEEEEEEQNDEREGYDNSANED